MKKVTALKVLNPILAILAAGQLVTIVIMKIQWISLVAEIHEWNGYALICAACIHLFLNWSWVKTSFFAKKKVVVSKTEVSKTTV